jgi:phage-related protein
VPVWLESFVQPVRPIFDSIHSPVTTVFAQVLPIIRSAVGTLADTVPSLLLKIHAILKTVSGVFPAIAAPVNPRFDTVVDSQIAGHRLTGQH